MEFLRHLLQNAKEHVKLYISLLFLTLITTSMVFFVLLKNEQSPINTQPSTQTVRDKNSVSGGQKEVPSLSVTKYPYFVVYGTWASNGTSIKAVDVATGKKVSVATLPINVKKVAVISPNNLLYISDTDDRDHGKNLAIYNTKEETLSIRHRPVLVLMIMLFHKTSNTLWFGR